MSTARERYKWYEYVRWMIRLYPARVQELRRLQHAAKVTPYDRGGVFHGNTVSRPTEILGTVTLGAPATGRWRPCGRRSTRPEPSATGI